MCPGIRTPVSIKNPTTGLRTYMETGTPLWLRQLQKFKIGNPYWQDQSQPSTPSSPPHAVTLHLPGPFHSDDFSSHAIALQLKSCMTGEVITVEGSMYMQY